MEDENDILEALKNVEKNKVNIITVAKEVLGDGEKSVTLNLAQKPVKPERMESQPRGHVFHDVDGFIKYLEKNPSENLVVLADVEETKATAVLNDKAEYGREFVSFEPPYHPQFLMMKESLLDHGPLNITRFAMAIMRNRDIIIGQDGILFNTPAEAKQLGLNMKQITVSSKVTAQAGVGADCINGVVCHTKITGTDMAGEKAELPQSIEVKVPIYIHTDAVTFSINLTIQPHGDDAASIVTDAPELEVRKYEVFEKLLEPLKKQTGVLVSYGNPHERSWNYIS
jgi:hypothetical protein